MNTPDLRWTHPLWRAQAKAWITSRLSEQNIQIAGEIDHHSVRPWATVWRVPTNEGSVYFKATVSGLSHESALCQALSRWRPDCMLPVLAVDLEKGWMLTRDGGKPLRALIQSDGDLSRLERVLHLYAEVQIQLSERLPELLELDVDRRLSVFPSQYERLVNDKDAMLVGQPDGLSVDQHAQLHSMIPRVTELCERLAEFDIPETIQHDDFHDNNVFFKDGQYWLADWGDSCVSHPFCSLTVALRSPAHAHKLAANGQEIAALRDEYLKPWTPFLPRKRLLEAASIANRLGMISRALTWHRIVSSIQIEARAEHAPYVPGWLLEFLEAEKQIPKQS